MVPLVLVSGHGQGSLVALLLGMIAALTRGDHLLHRGTEVGLGVDEELR